ELHGVRDALLHQGALPHLPRGGARRGALGAGGARGPVPRYLHQGARRRDDGVVGERRDGSAAGVPRPRPHPAHRRADCGARGKHRVLGGHQLRCAVHRARAGRFRRREEPMTAAPNVAPAPPPVADAPPAPVPMAPVDPLTFTDDAPAFSDAVRAILATPVDPELVEVRQPNDLLYVPWTHYQAILLRAFGPGGYKLVPRSVPRTEGNVITWVKALFVRPPGTTRFQFIKEAKGECNAHGGMTAGNAAEGAHSDALVKC